MHIAEKFKNQNDKNEVLDIDLTPGAENPFYISPLKCEKESLKNPNNALLKELCEYDVSYFNVLISRIQNGQDVRNLFYDKFHEPNETRIGYGRGDRGKALSTYTQPAVTEMIIDKKRPYLNSVKRVSDLRIYFYDISFDRASDIFTNIVWEALNNYTIKICKRNGIATRKFYGSEKRRYFWDKTKWVRIDKEHPVECYIPEGQDLPVLFVPECICYHLPYNDKYDIGHFHSFIVVETLIKAEEEKHPGKTITKKEMRKRLKNTDLDYSKNNAKIFFDRYPDMTNAFHDRMLHYESKIKKKK